MLNKVIFKITPSAIKTKEHKDSKKEPLDSFKNRNSGLKFDRQIFGPYDLSSPGIIPNEYITGQKDFADEIKVTHQLTLKWGDYPGASNTIIWALKRKGRQESS